MKKYLLATGVASLTLIATACGSEDSSGSGEDNSSSEESNSEESSENDNNNESNDSEESSETEEADGSSGNDEVETAEGETVETEAGEFEVVSRVDDPTSFSSGPMETTVNNVIVASGTVNEEYQDILEMDDDQLDYVQINMTTENTSEDTVSFMPDMATITTNTGEQLESDGFFSEFVDSEFNGPVTQESNAIYLLESSNPEEIETVRMIIDPATDENFEPVEGAEEIDEEISLN